MPDATAHPAAFTEGEHESVHRITPVVLAVFFGFMAMGIPLPVLPQFVHAALGYSGVLVGCVISTQSIATLLTRPFAGRLCDKGGPQRATTMGLIACGAAGLLYAVASWFSHSAESGLIPLLAGRIALGLGESLLITGALAWGVGLAGVYRTGKVMALTGIAMYGALAVGAPLGAWLFDAAGFVVVAFAALVFPVIGLVSIRRIPGVCTVRNAPTSFVRIVGLIWLPGAALALSTIAFGALAAFLPLLYADRHWRGVGVAFSAFGVAYVFVRLVLGGLPDRIGGRPVAIGSLLVECAGQVLIWQAGTPIVAMLGAALTGCGFSLVFPALGVQALARAASEPRGITLGAYVAFFDLSLAVTGPVAGWIAAGSSYPMVFLIGALGTAGALSLTLVSPRVFPRLTPSPFPIHERKI